MNRKAKEDTTVFRTTQKMRTEGTRIRVKEQTFITLKCSRREGEFSKTAELR